MGNPPCKFEGDFETTTNVMHIIMFVMTTSENLKNNEDSWTKMFQCFSMVGDDCILSGAFNDIVSPVVTGIVCL